MLFTKMLEPFEKQKNKCAFIIPLHPKHFDYGYYIINELKDSDADVYFVFSNQKEKNQFENKLSNEIKLNYLLLDSFIDISIANNTSSHVSIKKLYAISVLYEKYDYLSCIDSEIKFLKKNGFYEMMQGVVNSKIICGGILDTDMKKYNIVHDSLTKLIDESYHDELRKLSYDYKVYTWWSNIPVCDCKIVKHFLDWIHFSNTTLENRINWNVFDDITYNFFCILFYNYKLEIIPNWNSSLEDANTETVQYINDNVCRIYWINNAVYSQNKEYYDNNNVYITYHLDRG